MREERDNYMDLCPESDGANALALELVHQVLALHPGCKRIHVGCDEVFSLGSHPLSKAKAAAVGRQRLFLDHAGAVMAECARLGVVPLLWHDMMARFDVEALRAVAEARGEVVVWSYGADVEAAVPGGMWERLAAAGVRVWGASAFKGASQPDAVWVPTARHVANHESWLHRAARTPLQGIILTGWARFNHTAALCETLPAGLPSLALNLAVLRNGSFSEDLRARVWTSLGLPPALPLSPAASDLTSLHSDGTEPSFPGGAMFRCLALLEGTRLNLARTLENRRLFCPPYTHRLSPPLWRQMAWHARAARTTVDALRREATAAAAGVLTPAGLAELLGAKFVTLAQQAADATRDMRGLLRQHTGMVARHDLGAGRVAQVGGDDDDDDADADDADDDHNDEEDDIDGEGLAIVTPTRPQQPSSSSSSSSSSSAFSLTSAPGTTNAAPPSANAARRAQDSSPRAVLATVIGRASGLGPGSRAAALPGSRDPSSFEARHLMLDPRWFLLGARALVPQQPHDDSPSASSSRPHAHAAHSLAADSIMSPSSLAHLCSDEDMEPFAGPAAGSSPVRPSRASATGGRSNSSASCSSSSASSAAAAASGGILPAVAASRALRYTPLPSPHPPGLHRTETHDGGISAQTAEPTAGVAAPLSGNRASSSPIHLPARDQPIPSVGHAVTAADTSAATIFGPSTLGTGALAAASPGALIEGGALCRSDTAARS